MSTFSRIKNRLRNVTHRQEAKDQARAAECRKAVEAVLESYNVELQPYLIYHPSGVYPDVQFYPRPDKPHEPGKPTEPPSVSGTALVKEAPEAHQ